LTKKKIVTVSGGFDPIHVGHVRMIQEAATYGDVIIIANSDKWLKRKKGYVFMSYEERQEILYALKGVVDVMEADDDDNTVCKTLEKIKPDIFANGGDRKTGNVPEYNVCRKLGIDMLFGIGGNDKPQSSSWLVDKATKSLQEVSEVIGYAIGYQDGVEKK
jgi:D-beta-D-heptose 7-phosphate kinase/D-beta-D-heptose 1-phosphate adenosyltransferase